MLSGLITNMLQDFLKDRFSGFAYWLFGSEALIGLVIGLLALSQGELIGLAGWWYSCLCLTQLGTYEKKRKAKYLKQDWRPPVPMFVVRGIALAGTALILVGLGFIIHEGGSLWISWLIWACAALAAWELFRTCQGRWSNFP